MGENMGSGVQNLGIRESVCGVFSLVTCEWRIIGIIDLFTGLRAWIFLLGRDISPLLENLDLRTDIRAFVS